MKRSLRLTLEGLGWLSAWRLARALPERWVIAGFSKTSARSYKRNAKQRAIVQENLAAVVGPEAVDAAAREAFHWYGRYWAETFRMEDLSSEELNRRFTCDGCEIVEAAYAGGKGAVLATLHLGNWDAGGRWVAERWPLTAVVEVLRPQMLFERFVEHRRALGMTIIPLERGGDVTKRCLEQLAKGELLALVADRDLSGSGVEVTMFGRTTKVPPGPAVLAMRSGAPLIPACIYQGADGAWNAWVMPPIEITDPDAPDAVPRTLQTLADAFARMIEREPAQWHVFNRYWIDR